MEVHTDGHRQALVIQNDSFGFKRGGLLALNQAHWINRSISNALYNVIGVLV